MEVEAWAETAHALTGECVEIFQEVQDAKAKLARILEEDKANESTDYDHRQQTRRARIRKTAQAEVETAEEKHRSASEDRAEAAEEVKKTQAAVE
eukprot:9441045-Heterocapsa_arctica.AAC.1